MQNSYDFEIQKKKKKLYFSIVPIQLASQQETKLMKPKQARY